MLNPRYVQRKAAEEIELARRFDQPVAMMMADLDYLRTIDNTHGHITGDAVIAGIGAIIAQQVRQYDVAGRFGGEEFCSRTQSE